MLGRELHLLKISNNLAHDGNRDPRKEGVKIVLQQHEQSKLGNKSIVTIYQNDLQASSAIMSQTKRYEMFSSHNMTVEVANTVY